MTKGGDPYITFISFEAAELVRRLLTDHSKAGEEIGPQSYIFTPEGRNRPLSPSMFEKLWRRLCDEAGLDLRPLRIKGLQPIAGGRSYREEAYRYNVRVHALRKFFKTACSISGVDRMASEAFLGHSLSRFGVESVYDYSVTRLEWLRDEYVKALPNVVFLRPLPRLRAENHEAREKIRELEEENRRLQEWREEVVGFLLGEMEKPRRQVRRRR